MASAATSSASRYKPAIVVLFAISAAASGAYLVYSSLQSPPSGGLHRSNAVRRAPRRHQHSGSARLLQTIQQNTQPLGEFDFFGTHITLDAANLISTEELREIAHRSHPDASPELVENQIAQLYDTFLDRLLALTFPRRALIPRERQAITGWLGPLVPDQEALTQALERHTGRFSGVVPDIQGDLLQDSDGAESIAPTELSWRSDDDSGDDMAERDGQTLQRTLYHIAEDRARQEGVIHRGITCNGCDTKPIRGIRWRCANCADFDLCSDCEATNSHTKTHIFYKIRVPAPYLGLPKQPPVYPGRPHVMSPSISTPLKRRLVSETKMEGEEIEALWDQFTCLAATEWEDDPNNIGWAVDRRSFNQAFIPRYSSFESAPNLIYDRIFAYYDTDHNGLIGFEELIKGLDGMHSRDPKIKLRIVFNGYDVDGDGYISRKDVLRIFRAYYAIEKEATRNYIAETTDELSVGGALDTIHSSQPLGSAFTQHIPNRTSINPRLQQKSADEVEDSHPTVGEDIEDVADREEILEITDPRYHIQNNTSVQSSSQIPHDRAVRERWNRRQFYVDEEEGLSRPEGVEDPPPSYENEEQSDGAEEIAPKSERGLTRSSRSSSRVRFQDDVDVETRSNASTSSRPIGERWGGYEIPEPEKDLGKEVLYQITQQAFNELLNPLFQEKEDMAMDAFATRVERRKLAAQVHEILEEFKREKDINITVVDLGMFGYIRRLVTYVTTMQEGRDLLNRLKTSQLTRSEARARISAMLSAAESEVVHSSRTWPDGWEPKPVELWNAKLSRLQLRNEFEAVMLDLATENEWLPSDNIKPETPIKNAEPASQIIDILPYRDPTMPQFRPNSLADIRPPTPADETSRSVSGDSYSDASSGPVYDRVHLLSLENNGFVHHTDAKGPFFIFEAFDYQSSSDASVPLSSPTSTAPSMPQLVPPQFHPLPNRSTAPSPPVAPPMPDDPTIFLLWINTDDLSIHAEPRPVSHTSSWEQENSYSPLDRKIRRIAAVPESPLHLALLASLEAVEQEISERKGPGLLSHAEFEEKVMGEGRLRFLEVWMDWVSF
ncbi:hypothetical protein K469DRAFT_716805 [Zopfia rhizophila CBS 207.26]|uniref:EF-hand n=1 Tax=Zopfia rhizophila CBS 207.26 TaxID=1314779 RepID=A0A6A6EMC1_9PEZI|nr:hypothetical protein K469DRAFT_716805 [Zopfia rhizophila CBS 207.26]